MQMVNKRRFFVVISLIVVVLLLSYWIKHGRLNLFMLEYPQGTGTFSVVRDIRGLDPYMTIKMKCFYDDGNNRYGDQWERLLRDNTCHEQLFTKCFKERTVPQRRETHVLTFHGSKHVNRCVCTDVAGWYRHKCSNNTTHVKCCLDRGGKTVQCRI